MKAEIITIQSGNYGNRLQNYALQETLKKIGIKTTTNRIENKTIQRKFREIAKALRSKNVSDYFSYFNIKNIKFRYSTEMHLNSRYIDYYIAGSDQIWNPNFPFNSDREFLSFAPSKKKISYAASIGVTELSKEEKSRFINNLSDFHAISVRENEAADLIYSLIGKRPEVVLDPTMLLTKEEWLKVSKQSRLQITKPFILKYFLGVRNGSIEQRIEDFAKENDFEVIDITSSDCPYIIGPAEFVYLFQFSAMNFVDSYHGTVFSIIFNKPFYTFSRPEEKCSGDMNSRFETIFSLFPINKRYVTDFEKFQNVVFSSEIDYSTINRTLEIERDKSIIYLKNAMRVV